MPERSEVTHVRKVEQLARDPDHYHATAQTTFGWRVFEISAIAISVLVVASVLWLAIDVLLLLFGSVLLATFLRAPTTFLSTRTRLNEPIALLLVVVALLALFAAVGALLVPQVVQQMPRLLESLAASILSVARDIGFADWAESMTEDFDVTQVLPSAEGLVGGATGIIASTFGAIANFAILIVIGIYLAASPSLYMDGATRLVPATRRARARDILKTIGHTLRWWLIGQLVSMTAVGILTYIALSALGVPLAMTLAFIAFLLTFIPFIGPLVAGIPVLLVAFAEGFQTGLYALALYTLIQSFEGYVLTPLVQRQSVRLPPALTIAAQIMLGVLVGGIGIALATPIAAASLVAVKMVYVEDVLGEATDAS